MTIISNDDLARILGRMEAKLDEQSKATLRMESGLASLDQKVARRLDEHDQRLRELEVANPAKLAQEIADHDARIVALEKGAAKAGVLAGVGSSVLVAAVIEFLKHKVL